MEAHCFSNGYQAGNKTEPQRGDTVATAPIRIFQSEMRARGSVPSSRGHRCTAPRCRRGACGIAPTARLEIAGGIRECY